MNFPLFIAKRIAFSRERSFSKVIIRIATVAVALSVAVMVTAMALIAGFKSEISNKIFEFWGHIHISDSSYSLFYEPAAIDRDQDFYPSLDSVSAINYTEPERILGVETGNEVECQSRGGIRHIQAFAHIPGIIRTKTEMEGVVLKGVGEDFGWESLEPYLLEGRPIAWTDSTPSREVIISQQTANRLQMGLNDKFIVYFIRNGDQIRRRFEIVGIYKTGLEEYDRKFALCDLRVVQDLLGWDSNQVAGFEVWLDDLQDLDLYNQFIYTEVLPPDLVCVTIKEKFPAIFEWLSLQDYNEIVILSLMLAVAIINMITALLVLVLERSNMIGVLKALGAANGRIRRIFLYHAAVITLRGMFWGNLIGLGLCWLQDKYHLITLNETDYYLSYAPVKLEWLSIAGVNLGTLLLTLLFLIVPSMLVSNISPVKAIRFK
ncbi:MAG: FtsX-like permease family protein [Saprospiraceae bacterium]